MKIALIRTLSGLKPVWDSDNEKLKKIPLNDILEYEVKVPRGIKFHRKFFALMKLVYDNQEEFNDFNTMREAITIAAGYMEEKQRLNGEVTIEAKSIAFSNMDEIEFGSLYTSCLDVIVDYFKFDKMSIEQEIVNFY